MSNETANAPPLSVVVELSEDFVLRALPQRVTEGAIAKELGFEPALLRRAFLTLSNAPIHRAINRLRLKIAHYAFQLNPDLPPEAVAVQCGFDDFGVFSRNYRINFGHEVAERHLTAALDPASLPASHYKAVLSVVNRVRSRGRL